jgi:hypothetical protein
VSGIRDFGADETGRRQSRIESAWSAGTVEHLSSAKRTQSPWVTLVLTVRLSSFGMTRRSRTSSSPVNGGALWSATTALNP